MEIRSRLRRTVRDVDDVKELVSEMLPEGYSPEWLTSKKSGNFLGYRYWLVILVAVGGIYGLVVYQDHRMPSVVPANQYKKFSEQRARKFLESLTSLGPRPSGSTACEVDAFNIIMNKLDSIRNEIEEVGVNRLEIDVQRPSGCYDLKFLSSFTLCYTKITNIIARIGPKNPGKHAILLNSHFDTIPDSPGATDDAVSCAIMMEVLEILSHRNTSLENDIIFLFNGAEENFLQASHGFITQHPWRHSIRAFVNLEGSGAGGREILFQAGPANSWLLETYLQNVPFPHCSVLAQEIFQAGIIPSDTDFRVFRDYGRISGLDIAYFRNGWVYHTEFDLPEFIANGCIQRAGENIFALTEALVKSPYLNNQENFTKDNQWVFYDVIGLFTVYYPVQMGVLYNYATVLVVFFLIAFRLRKGVYGYKDVLWALVHHFIAASFTFVAGLMVMTAVIKLDLVMCWYKCPELVFPLYIFPMLLCGCAVHSVIASRTNIPNPEIVHFDSVLLIFSIMLAAFTYNGFASAFFLLIHVLFPLLRDLLLYIFVKLRFISRISLQWLLFAQLTCTAPVIVFGAYAVMLLYDFLVPVTGRLGNAINPEFVIMPLSFLTAFSVVLFTNNLVYVTRRMNYLLKCGFALFLFFFMVLCTTRLGWPYYYSESSPRLRRIIALDSKRTIFPFNGNIPTVEHGLFVQTLDYRGIDDLPDHTLLSGSNRPNCKNITDEYCRLPFYTAIHELFPPEESRWIPLPAEIIIPVPLNLSMVAKRAVSDKGIMLNFILKGGYDKMSLHLTPLNGYVLKEWSFTDINIEKFGRRNTYFVFLTYGFEAPPRIDFWILLEKINSTIESIDTPCLEVSVATHYAHGPHQLSNTLQQLKSLINERRKTLHLAIGWWKWAITSIAGVAEIVVHTF